MGEGEKEMIEYIRGDMFTSHAQALVVPVNCIGVAGAGLALQFKNRYPRWYRLYHQEYLANRIETGKVFYISLLKPMHADGPEGVISFPTKYNWRNPSLIGYIDEGLQSLIELVKLRDIKSVALPKLGCGLGKLSWSEVKPLYEKYLASQRTGYEVYEYDGSDN